MKPFHDLARKVALQWRRAKGTLISFTGIATRALEEFDYDLKRPELDRMLGAWLEKTSPLPEQVNLHNTFGQPPVTLFNDGRFVLDLYFWLTFDTSIHSHGFRGAFRVLHGKSLNEVFSVVARRAIAPDVALVELGLSEASLLEPGAVRPIHPGLDLTHRVIHLEVPTVTLCLRTINEPRIAQWKYFPGGLALQMRRLEPSLIKKIYYFQYLFDQDPKRASGYLDRILATLDRSTSMNLYGAIASGTYDLSEAAARGFAARLRKRYGSADWFHRYERVDQAISNELHPELCMDPLGRLVAHLANAAPPAGVLADLLRGRSKAELDAVVLSLVDQEGLFGPEVPEEDREEIKVLLSDPETVIPEPLRHIGQVGKLRAFLRRLGEHV